MKSETLRRMWALFAGALIFAAAGSARAQDAGKMACVNDPDCPGAMCGGDVCQYGAEGQFCVKAGTDKKGHDGWCTVDTDCKCNSLGAKCVAAFCTFTLPADAPGGGAGGSSGAGGAAATGSGGTSAAPAASSDSGGCSMTSRTATGLGSAGLLVSLGAIAFSARRRRRAA